MDTHTQKYNKTHLNNTILFLFLTWKKSHSLKDTNFPQYIHQNLKKPPLTTKPYAEPSSRSSRPPALLLSAAAWNPAIFFLKAPKLPWQQCYCKSSPFITRINIRKGLSQKEPIHTIILITFSWELASVKTITHADYSPRPLFSFLKYICVTTNLTKTSLQKWLWRKLWSINSKKE